jgi:acyl carrier protein
MVDHNVLEREISAAFSIILGLAVTPEQEVERSETPEWDSLKHMELIFAIEDRFGVQFSEAELAELSSKSKVVKLLSELL